ncbi:MAG: hypothetical protein ACR2J4_10825 [Deinococcus sp.]
MSDKLKQAQHDGRDAAKVQVRLEALERRSDALSGQLSALGRNFPKRRRGGGTLRLLLLAGLGYALSNPQLRQRLLNLVGGQGDGDDSGPAVVREIRHGRGPTGAAPEVSGGPGLPNV